MLIAAAVTFTGLAALLFMTRTPAAHADYFRYPCQPPGVGTGVDVNIVVDAQGQFCDGPTEINLTHLHCESGGATVFGGGIALAPVGGISLGGIGGSGLGAGGSGCSWRCPDNTLAPAPNPPMVWQHSFIDPRAVIAKGTAFCVREGHLVGAGPTSEMVSPDEGFPDAPDKPWERPYPNIPMPRPAPAPHTVEEEPPGNLPAPPFVPPLPLPPTIPPIPGVPVP